MASNSRIIGFTLFKMGLVIVLLGLVALFGPKLADEVGKRLLPEKFKPATSVEGDAKAEAAGKVQATGWDPRKEALPPGMSPVKVLEAPSSREKLTD